MHTIHTITFYLARWLGLSDINGSWYAFWSGVGADLGELTIVGAIIGHLRSSKKQRDLHHEQLKHHIDYKFSKLTDEETH